MKKFYVLLVVAFLGYSTYGQTFQDDFESYSSSDKLAASSPTWGAWSGINGGGADDISISTARAHSGTNAVRFASNAESGGPADIVLHFGNEINSGQFSLSFEMFVETGKSAYFNLQQESKPGEVWVMDAYFNNDATFRINNSIIGTRVLSTYTQNEWINIRFEIDLNTNTYELFIDETSVGTFQNNNQQIASLNFYPTQGNDYHIDDVTYNYVPYNATSKNASLTFIDGVEGFLAGATVTPSIQLRNLGTEDIGDAEIKLSYNGYSKSQSFTDLNLENGAYKSLEWENIVIAPGENQLVAEILKIDGGSDDNTSDNSKTLFLDPISPTPGRLVIGEEATGTWCGWCPRGAVALENMDQKYHGFFQGIAVHNGDPMVNGNYDRGLGTIISGYPSGSVDRGADIDPGNFEEGFLERIVTEPAGVMTTAATFDEETRELKVSLTTKFNQDISGNYKIACVIIEDSVTGTSSAYRQANYYSGGARGEMGGYENLPNPVPAEDMVYNHVARSISPNFGGLPNAFGDVLMGESKTHEFSFDINYYWNPEKFHIVGLLIEPGGRISNGSSATIGDALEVDYASGELVVGVLNLDPTNLSVSPNPTSDFIKINIGDGLTKYEAALMDVQGKVLWEGMVSDGYEINVSEFVPGTYILKTATFAKKIIVH